MTPMDRVREAIAYVEQCLEEGGDQMSGLNLLEQLKDELFSKMQGHPVLKSYELQEARKEYGIEKLPYEEGEEAFLYLARYIDQWY